MFENMLKISSIISDRPFSIPKSKNERRNWRERRRRGKGKKKCREEEMMERNTTLREYQKVWNIDARFLSFHSFREWKFQQEKRERNMERAGKRKRGWKKKKERKEKVEGGKVKLFFVEKFVERNKHQIMNDFCSLIQYLLIQYSQKLVKCLKWWYCYIAVLNMRR